jgi:hypothetical protein
MSQDLPNLIWVDCEMTGLDINKDALVEIAVLVTDAQLNVLGEGVDPLLPSFPIATGSAAGAAGAAPAFRASSIVLKTSLPAPRYLHPFV